MDFGTVSLSFEGTIWTLKIKRPEVMNALSAQVLNDIEKALAEVRKADFSKCRCLIVTGEGEKAFVAGADIKEIHAVANAQTGIAFSERGQNVFREFEKLNVAVIAAVNGFALGGGMELALACDFVYASENAKFGLPEVGLGLLPGFGGTVRLARVVGLNKAREIIFSGEFFTAQQAQQINLVSKVVPAAELMNEVNKVAKIIAGRGPFGVALAKRSLLKSFDEDIDNAMKTEAKSFGELFKYQDTKEGTKAFIEKRAPQFFGQ